MRVKIKSKPEYEKKQELFTAPVFFLTKSILYEKTLLFLISTTKLRTKTVN
jgi:hypothetical protein